MDRIELAVVSGIVVGATGFFAVVIHLLGWWALGLLPMVAAFWLVGVVAICVTPGGQPA